jgi:hypothetical protein
MTYILASLTVFVSAILIIIALMLLYLFAKVGYSIKNLRHHFSDSGEGRGALGGIIAFPIVLSLLAVLAFYMHNAEAQWFQYTEVYAGLDYTYKVSPMCHESHVDDRLTSHGGVRQHVYNFGRDINLVGAYTHHSCAIGRDKYGYDALGVQVVWRFDRRNK